MKEPVYYRVGTDLMHGVVIKTLTGKINGVTRVLFLIRTTGGAYIIKRIEDCTHRSEAPVKVTLGSKEGLVQ